MKSELLAVLDEETAVATKTKMKKGITLRVGVKNVLDDTFFYQTQLPKRLSEYEYRGRTWWLQLSYDF